VATKKQKPVASDGASESEEKKKPVKRRVAAKKPTNKKRVLKRAPSTLEPTDESIAVVSEPVVESVVEPVVEPISEPAVFDEQPVAPAQEPIVEDFAAQQALADEPVVNEPAVAPVSDFGVDFASTPSPEPISGTEPIVTPFGEQDFSTQQQPSVTPSQEAGFDFMAQDSSTAVPAPEFQPETQFQPQSDLQPQVQPESQLQPQSQSQPQDSNNDFGAGWQDFATTTPSSDIPSSSAPSDDVVIPDFATGKEENKYDSGASNVDSAPTSFEPTPGSFEPVSSPDVFTESVPIEEKPVEQKVLSEDRFMDLSGGDSLEEEPEDKSEFLGEVKSSLIGTFRFKKAFGCVAVALILIGIGFYLFYGKVNFLFNTWDKVTSLVKKTETVVTQNVDNASKTIKDIQVKVENKNTKPQPVSSQEGFIKEITNLSYKVGESYEVVSGGPLTSFLETAYIVGVSSTKKLEINTGLVAAFRVGFTKSILEDNVFKKYVRVFGELKNVYDTDIYNVLNNSTNRSAALDSELATLEDVYKRGTEQDGLILKEMDQMKADAKLVDAEKSKMETAFFEDLKAAKPDESFDKITSFTVLTQKKGELSVRYNALKTLDNYYKIVLKRVGIRIDDIKKNKDALIQGVRVYEVPGSNVDVIIKSGTTKIKSNPLDSSLGGGSSIVPGPDNWNVPKIQLNF